MSKAEAVQAFIGKEYRLKDYNCWHMASEVMRALYGVEMPKFRARDYVSSTARQSALEGFAGWESWRRVSSPEDGALGLMLRMGCRPDPHVGVWVDFGPQSGCLHNDSDVGRVVFDDLLDLRNRYSDIRWYLPV